MAKTGYLYIMASKRNGTLYVGMTSDLLGRVWQHRKGAVPGFTARYGVKRLVHYEVYDNITAAIAREKVAKKWRRRWKLTLIEAANPDWRDLYADIAGFPPSRE